MFEGSMVALITPMKNGKVDEQGLRRLVNFQEDNGIDVLVPCGTTGESATLTLEEHEKVIEIVVDESNKAKVMAGSGSNSTHETLRLTKHAARVGCDAALVITPYYNKPPQRGMYEHFRRVADESDIDIVLYNVPSRTGINLKADTVARLARISNIVAVKEASGDMGQVSEIITKTPEDFSVLSGDDALTLPLLAVGGRGVVSVVANIVPDRVSGLVNAWKSGDLEKAQQIHQEIFPLMQAMFMETNPIPVKAAANMKGLCENELRSPMVPLDSQLSQRLKKIMLACGVSIDD
ncbi:MAG: 4-hydroxy-tetrahydrodipicolinate synthase [bacterium]